jgi:hypothetical protein
VQEPSDELQYVEVFLDGNRQLVGGIVIRLVEEGAAEYDSDSGHLSLVAKQRRWRSQWLHHVFTLPDGRKGTGSVRLPRDAFAPPQRTLTFYVAARLADMDAPGLT